MSSTAVKPFLRKIFLLLIILQNNRVRVKFKIFQSALFIEFMPVEMKSQSEEYSCENI